MSKSGTSASVASNSSSQFLLKPAPLGKGTPGSATIHIKEEPVSLLDLINAPSSSTISPSMSQIQASNHQQQNQHVLQVHQPQPSDLDHHELNAQIFDDARMLEELILNSPALNQAPSQTSPNPSQSSQPNSAPLSVETTAANTNTNEFVNDSMLNNVNMVLDDAMFVDLYHN